MSQMKPEKYGHRMSSLHDWTYYKIPYEEGKIDFSRNQISAPSFMRLCNILRNGKEKGIYVTQPGEKLREPWRKYDHPLDLLQNSLDLAAGKDIFTQEQFQNIPTISSSSSSSSYNTNNNVQNSDENKSNNNNNIDSNNNLIDKTICTIPGVEDVYLSRHFCRHYSTICNKLLLTKVLFPLKNLLKHREIEYLRKACRRIWVFVMYKRRQEREHKRITQIMNKLEKQGHHRFREKVRDMIIGWKEVARKERLHFFWQYKIFRLTWLWKRWNEYLNHQKWNNCGAVRLFLRMDKIIKKWNLYQTVRRFITWKENTERISIEIYKKWKIQTKRVFLYRWKLCLEVIKKERAKISYDLSRLPHIDVNAANNRRKEVAPPKSIKEVFSMANLPIASTSNTTASDNPALLELFERIRKRIMKENFTKWFYYYSYKIKIRQKINERREKRRNIKRVHSHPNSCHLHGCIVPCPPTCTYYQEQRRLRLYGWEEIKL